MENLWLKIVLGKDLHDDKIILYEFSHFVDIFKCSSNQTDAQKAEVCTLALGTEVEHFGRVKENHPLR